MRQKARFLALIGVLLCFVGEVGEKDCVFDIIMKACKGCPYRLPWQGPFSCELLANSPAGIHCLYSNNRHH